MMSQHELIACLGKVNSGGPTQSEASANLSSHTILIDSVRTHILEGRGAVKEEIKLLFLIGQGSVSKMHQD